MTAASYLPGLSLLLLVLGITIAVIVVSSRRRSAPGAASLIVFAAALIVWVVADFLYRMALPPGERFWVSLTYLGATVAPAAMLTFAIEYSERGDSLTWRVLALLALEPIAIQALYWTDPLHGLFLAGKDLQAIVTSFRASPCLRFNAIYSHSVVLIANILFLQVFSHRVGIYRRQSGVILAGNLAPVLLTLIGYTGLIPSLNLSLAAYTLAGAAFASSLAWLRLLDLVSIPREVAVEGMKDGWLVLDVNNRILDMNPAAEAIIGLPRRELYGQPAEKVLSDWPNLARSHAVNAPVLDEVGSVRLGDKWRYLNLRVQPLADRRGRPLGHIVIWRDITERRKAEEARQRARDEMFVLLRAIYGAASRAQCVDDFLAAAIYQIVYTFQSQACAIFLRHKSSTDAKSDRLLLAAHHGLPAHLVAELSAVGISTALKEGNAIAWVLERHEPLLIKDVRSDPGVPDLLKSMGHLSLLLIPMVMDGQILGLIAMARKKKLAYRTEEIARLSGLAEEIASFVHSDRRRQMATVLAERQRLVRGLHDGVTQKLYGLVTLTEAAKAATKAGERETPPQILARIGENARQSLKEMRLFLYELQPIDLERQGLVAVLNQRLAAVEGRADIKARLLADKHISLPLDRQVELYHIAQEALNNVLRHAHAVSVTVRLKQDRETVTLEIADDGCGFDTRQEAQGGLGLRHMQERAARIGGKCRISSKIGKGTKVTVSTSRK
jgi:PAS domain S-box-containing protein